MVSEPPRQRFCGIRKRGGIEQAAHLRLLGHKPIRIARSERVRPELLIGNQERVRESIVHPRGQLRSTGGVRPVAMRGSLNRPMGAAHESDSALYLGYCPKRRGGDVRRRARQPTEWILAIAGMVDHTCHDLGMGGLNQKSADAADECCGVADDGPRDRIRTEEAGVSFVRKRLDQRVWGVGKEAGCRRNDPIAEGIESAEIRHDISPLIGHE